MPLTELMNYFNDQLQVQVRIKSLPKTGFYKADNSYWARFGNQIFGSRFHPINTSANDKLIGYESELLVRSAAGNLLTIDNIFNSLDSNDQIIHLDRLVRTLHSLNYLQQYDGRKDLLSLHVQPRHIVSVFEDHGKTFEHILSDCGLGPERVLLHTRLLDNATLPHFHKALLNYRSRGYKIGISITQSSELELLENLGLQADVIFLHLPVIEHVSASRIHTQLLSKHGSAINTQRIIVNTQSELNPRSLNDFDGVLTLPEEKIEIIDPQLAAAFH